MEKRLAGKVAMVTGASRGIGRVISVALAKEGAELVLAARSVAGLEETARLVVEAGGRAEIITVELTDEESIKNLVAGVKEKVGRLDILVNNAGVTHSAKLEETAVADWDRCFETNVRAPFIVCREALGLLRASPAGWIINMSSSVGVKGYALQSAYAASKHALRGMSMVLAEELAGSNVRVQLLCPGAVLTEMVGRVRPDIKKDELILPEEIADIILFLLTHRGGAVMDQLNIRRSASSPWF